MRAKLATLHTFFARLSTLQLGIGFSVLVHVGLITMRFVDPQGFNRIFEDTPLEVVLVNAQTHEKQTDVRHAKAQVIAQHRLAGGGQADAGLASSPFPTQSMSEWGQTAEQQHRRLQMQIAQMQEQQTLMLSRLKTQALAAEGHPQESTVQGRAQQEQKRQQLLKLLAVIEKRINEENARPKKRYISAATREEVYAIYYDALRRRIEARGTQNFPVSMGRKLYGELTLVITVDASGAVLGTPEVVRSSGSVTLDRQAQAIAAQSAPFGSFTPQMRAQAEQLVVVSRFRFTREAELDVQVQAN